MPSVGLVVEGATDRIAAERILADTGATVDPARIVITNGKTRFDARIARFNDAARYTSWTALRDLDHDSGSCAVTVRSSTRREVRRAMVPPRDSHGTGPRYTELVSRFCSEAWKPAAAAEQSPTLARALAEIRTKIAGGAW